MRSDAWHRVAAVAVVVLAGATSCSSAADDAAGDVAAPTADERTACSRLQDLVDTIASGEPLAAMGSLSELESALAASGNETLSSNGREFFATISATVPDPGALTVEQTEAVGDQALAEAQPRLGALLDECAALGVGIDNLPTEASGR
jgi:hypothetical protein